MYMAKSTMTSCACVCRCVYVQCVCVCENVTFCWSIVCVCLSVCPIEWELSELEACVLERQTEREIMRVFACLCVHVCGRLCGNIFILCVWIIVCCVCMCLTVCKQCLYLLEIFATARLCWLCGNYLTERSGTEREIEYVFVLVRAGVCVTWCVKICAHFVVK
jgi:hypothetical protein